MLTTLDSAQEAHPRRDDLVVTAPGYARQGRGTRAWDALVERNVPLIQSICWRYRLGDADARTSRRPSGCGWSTSSTTSVTRPRSPAGWPPLPDEQAPTAEHGLLAAERYAALRRRPRTWPPAASS